MLNRSKFVVFTCLCSFVVLVQLSCGASEQSSYDGASHDLQQSPISPAPIPPILVDQFGYPPQLQKRAVIRSAVKGFDAGRSFTPSRQYAVVNMDSERIVFTGAPEAWNGGRVDPASGDKVWHFDFTKITQPGRYIIRDLENGVDSHPFEIRADIYKDVLKTAFKTLYLQRAGFEKRAPFAPQGYEDAASHIGGGQDKSARLFSKKHDSATERDLHGGWYDAGDYNQYTNWMARYIVSLLGSYVDRPEIWTDDFGIPESGNGQADILDEVKWGLDWLERMQNADGSVLSILGRATGSPPSSANGPSFYGPASSSATISAAGAFALAGKVYNNPAYTQRAERAWQWAEQNPDVRFKNNDADYRSEGLGAGQQEVSREKYQRLRLTAASYLYAATGKRDYARIVRRGYNDIDPMKPVLGSYVSELGFTMLYYARLRGISSKFRQRILSDYDQYVLQNYRAWPAYKNDEDAYGAYVDGYWWGGNAYKAIRGSVFMQARVMRLNTPLHPQYKDAALGYLNYLHGVNPKGKVYLSNMGALGAENSVNSFYHEWFTDGDPKYDDVRVSQYGPAPGFLVGGPNQYYEVDSCCKSNSCGSAKHNQMCTSPILNQITNQPPAKTYADFNESWPIGSWQITENSNLYQISYLRLLSKFVP